MRVARSNDAVDSRVTRNVQLRSSVSGASLRTMILSGVEYLVVPCVSKLGDNVEWPVNADTPEYIPGDVLRFTAESRNNRPVVMDHPQRNDEYVSANDPDIIEKYQFGWVFSAQYDNGSISCELWLDPIRAAAVGPDAARVIERLRSGEMVEVSEGNVVVIEKRDGVHNGKSYGAVWQLCFSDHVAMLPEGAIGACAIADGCGALRSSTLKVVNMVQAQVEIKVAALSQARRPTFTGTETTTWIKPTFADYVRYLHSEGDPPAAVAQCTATMKSEIAAHTLLGDPVATSFNDLSCFPVVNSSSGKLNENALRSIVNKSSVSPSSSITDTALKSAQDMARRLLNSEFGANLEASSMNEKESNSKKAGGLKRLLTSMAAKLRGAMSNNDLRWKLYKEIIEIDPRISYVVDEDTDTMTVIYCVVISFGDYYDYSKTEYHFFSRSFTMDAAGVVTIADGDPVEVELSESWKPIPVSEVIEEMDEPALSTGRTNEPKPVLATACACKGDNKMATEVKKDDRASILARLSAMSDDELKAVATVAGNTSTPAVEAVSAPVPVTTPTTPIVSSETIAIPAAEYGAIKAAADAYHRQQAERKVALVTQISTAQGKEGAFTADDLNAMGTDTLLKLAKSLKLEESNTAGDYSADYSLRGAPTSTLATRAAAATTHAPPKSWSLALAKSKEKNGTSVDKPVN